MPRPGDKPPSKDPTTTTYPGESMELEDLYVKVCALEEKIVTLEEKVNNLENEIPEK
jgi:hypothetical protein